MLEEENSLGMDNEEAIIFCGKAFDILDRNNSYLNAVKLLREVADRYNYAHTVIFMYPGNLAKFEKIADAFYDRGAYLDAFELFKTLADLGHGRSQYMVACMYRHGKDVYRIEQNYTQAAKYYRLCENVFPRAKENLSLIIYLAKLEKYSKPDFQRAVAMEALEEYINLKPNNVGLAKKFQKVVYKEGGVAWDDFTPDEINGLMFDSLGKIVTQFPVEDIKFLSNQVKQAADLGSPPNQSICQLYYMGIALLDEKKHQEASEFFKLAADQGLAVAQFRLAKMYYVGKQISKNYTQAAKYYRLAANQGDIEAENALENLIVRAKRHPDNPDFQRAVAIKGLEQYIKLNTEKRAVAEKFLKYIYKDGVTEKDFTSDEIEALKFSRLGEKVANFPKEDIQFLPSQAGYLVSLAAASLSNLFASDDASYGEVTKIAGVFEEDTELDNMKSNSGESEFKRH